LPADLPHFPVFIEAPDLSPWVAGNTGITGFTTKDSGLAGPHVVLISLIHGNEFAGAIVLDEMLRADFRPRLGKLTFGFANLAAFARFDPENPVSSRFVEEDMNRVWDDIDLFGVRRTLELDRARDIRPLIDTADIVLDLHSMLWPSEPLLLCGSGNQGRKLALAIGTPSMVIADQGHAGGKRLIDYGRFTEHPGQAGLRGLLRVIDAEHLHFGGGRTALGIHDSPANSCNNCGTIESCRHDQRDRTAINASQIC
jgi:hypothetical protein